MEGLRTFVKRFKQVPASSSNPESRRAAREVNRRARNTYSLEQPGGIQDRTARYKDLLVEAQLNVECVEMTKEVDKGLLTVELKDKRKQLPLETTCVFIAGMKQTLDPKKDLKRQIGTVQAKAYSTSRKGGGGMDIEAFDMIA